MGTSTTAGRDTEPPTDSSTVPGSSGVPVEAKASGPSVASRAIWANVSALDSSVGRLSTPLSLARILRPLGSAVRPLMALTSELLSPETNRSGTCTTISILRRSGSVLTSEVTHRAIS